VVSEPHVVRCALSIREVFVVTEDKNPTGELRPVREHFVTRQRLLEAFAGAPPIHPARFRSDVDASIDQDLEPRA